MQFQIHCCVLLLWSGDCGDGGNHFPTLPLFNKPTLKQISYPQFHTQHNAMGAINSGVTVMFTHLHCHETRPCVQQY